MELKEELQQLSRIIDKLKVAIIILEKYKGNQHYKKQYSLAVNELNRAHTFLRAKMEVAPSLALEEKLNHPNPEGWGFLKLLA